MPVEKIVELYKTLYPDCEISVSRIDSYRCIRSEKIVGSSVFYDNSNKKFNVNIYDIKYLSVYEALYEIEHSRWKIFVSRVNKYWKKLMKS